MDKTNLTFLILCILVICGAFSIYKYNSNRYSTQSVMEVIPMDETTQTLDTSYITSNTTTEIKNSTYLITSTTTIENSIINTTTTSLDTTLKTTITTTSNTKPISTSGNIITKDTQPTTIQTTPNFPISLNSITFEELQYIKGIGEVTAQKIIDYRNSIGCYTSRYQLLDINGIGESKMNIIMEYTYIEDENLNYYEDTPQEEYMEYQEGVDAELLQDDTITPIETIPEVTENPYPIDLNSATLEDLMLIPNVTQDIAQKILDLRDTIQYYSNPYELLYIDGITERYLSDMMEYITVN